MSQSSTSEIFNTIQSSLGAKENNKDDTTFSLQVVSPSVGVPTTLEFHQLSVHTEVKQLKALIRDSIQSNPPDEQQRLIHRGRMLARETETMIEIFGEETLKASGNHIIHLVLRNLPENTESRPNYRNPPVAHDESTHGSQFASRITENSVPRYNLSQRLQAPSVLRNSQRQNIVRQVEAVENLVGQRLQRIQLDAQQQNQENNAVIAQGLSRVNSNDSRINGQGGQSFSTALLPEAPLLNQPPEITSIQNLIAQQQPQRLRSNDGYQSIPQREYSAQGVAGTTSNQNLNMRRPDQSTMYIRECYGLNGERWQVTVNETTTTIPVIPVQNRHLTQQIESGLNPHSIFRTSDSSLSNQGSNNQIQGTEPNIPASAAHMPSTSSFGSSGTSSLPTLSNTNSSPYTTPLFPSNTPATNTGESGRADYATNNTQTPSEPLVYILSSHTGPRAILISNSQSFYTPLRNSIRHRTTFTPIVDQGIFLDRSRTPVRRIVRERRNPNVNLPEPALPHANMRFGGMGAQIGQTLWLIARLVGFVWFFTTGNPSWTRWFMVNGLALIIFIMYTGFFNGTAEQFWNPIRRHLDALIPLGPPNPQNAPIIPNGVRLPTGNEDRNRPRTVPTSAHIENAPRRRGELDPAEVAARILEQQRLANDSWLLSQLRRLEQALLLFVASLVPGIGERHIAHREGEANRLAERQQQALEATNENATQAETDETPINAVTNQAEGENNLAEAEASSTEFPQNQGESLEAQQMIQV